MGSQQKGADGRRPLASAGPVLAIAAVGAISVIVLALSMFRDAGMPAYLSENYMRVAGDLVTPDIVASDATTLSSRLAGGPAGPVRVPEIDPLGYRLEGGGTVTLGGRPTAIAIYRNPSQELLVWQAFNGDAASLPGGADMRDEGGRSIHLHYKAATIIAAWQEGGHVATLTSTLPAEHLMAIVRVAVPARR